MPSSVHRYYEKRKEQESRSSYYTISEYLLQRRNLYSKSTKTFFFIKKMAENNIFKMCSFALDYCQHSPRSFIEYIHSFILFLTTTQGRREGGQGGTMTSGPRDFRGRMGFRKAVGFSGPSRGPMSSSGGSSK